MTWWYENEADEMKLYKNEDLCIGCKNAFFSKPWDHRDPTPGQLGYCIKCDNFLTKEKKMEFDGSRVYSALNADELKAGDKVIVAHNLYGIKEQVKMFTESAIDVIEVIQDEDYFNRFKVKHGESYPLAYLVERAENCTNCEEAGKEGGCRRHGEIDKILCCDCYTPKTEQKAEKHTNYNYYDEAKKAYACPEKHYRPFKDTDELIKVFCEKTPKIYDKDDEKLFMPYIWVRRKESNCKGQLITKFSDPLWVIMSTEGYNMTDLFEHFTFLDGSPCGVEE